MELPISKKVFFQPNLLFSQKGESLDFRNQRIKTINSYLDLPLNIGYKFSKKFSFSGGPYLGYLLNSSIGRIDNDSAMAQRGKSFNYGWNATLAYEFKNGFVISANYSRGTIYGLDSRLISKINTYNNVWGLSATAFFGGR